MATTTYLEWDDQTTGANNNTWGDVADANWTIMETAIARFLSVATTGGTTVLSTAQNRYPVIRITGTLVSNATIQVRTAEKNWIFINATAGDYTVEVKTSAGTGKIIPRGPAVKLYCDGTNVEYARAPGIPHAAGGGTVNAITATFYPATVSADLEDGYLWIVEAAGANTTTTPTFNPDGTGALTIKKAGAQALVAGDIRDAGHKLLLCYDKSGGHVELLNPYNLAPASDTVRGAVEISTAAEYRNDTADRALTGAVVWDSAEEVTLTDDTTIAVDMATFINAKVTLAGNRTLGDPSNGKAGQAGCIRIIQDATGSRTLAFGAQWKFAGGTDPTLTTTAAATDLLFYHVLENNVIFASLVKDIS